MIFRRTNFIFWFTLNHAKADCPDALRRRAVPTGVLGLALLWLFTVVPAHARADERRTSSTQSAPETAEQLALEPTTMPVPLVGRTLFTEAGATQYWMVTRQRDSARPEDVITLVRMTQRGVGKVPSWKHVARLSRAPVAVAAIDRRLALMYGDGTWQLVWPGSVLQGPTLPDGRRLLTLASRGESIVALAVAAGAGPTQAELWEFKSGWALLDVVPRSTGADDYAVAALAGGWYLVADWAGGDLTLTLRERDGRWRVLPTIPGSLSSPSVVGDPTAAVPLIADPSIEWVRVLGATVPSVVVKRVNTPARLLVLSDQLWQEQGVLDTPKPVAGLRTSVAEMDGELRLAWQENDAVFELAFDARGQSLTKQPRPLTVTRDPNQTSMWQSVMTLAMLGLLAVALVTTAWRPAPSVNEPAVARVIASHARRFVAGVIDATPVMACVTWIAFDAQARGQDPAQGLTGRQELLFGLSLLVYLVWTTLAELLTTRSVGKWVTGLYVVDAQGQRPRVGPLVLRNFMRLLDIYLLPLLLVFFTPLRQRLGDIASQTFVVQRRPESASPITHDNDDRPKPGIG